MTTTITISAQDGAITSTKGAGDANASRMIDGLLYQNGADPTAMTNQERVDATLLLIVAYVRQSAKAWEATEASKAAAEDVVNNFPPPFEDE